MRTARSWAVGAALWRTPPRQTGLTAARTAGCPTVLTLSCGALAPTLLAITAGRLAGTMCAPSIWTLDRFALSPRFWLIVPPIVSPLLTLRMLVPPLLFVPFLFAEGLPLSAQTARELTRNLPLQWPEAVAAAPCRAPCRTQFASRWRPTLPLRRCMSCTGSGAPAGFCGSPGPAALPLGLVLGLALRLATTLVFCTATGAWLFSRLCMYRRCRKKLDSPTLFSLQLCLQAFYQILETDCFLPLPV
mmetsp:Transcript_93648/g.171790  ORF Transcript_93648/g.171790 Transcript_93648/m.171790 type:complete len:246 (-) Transcript_93648:327-1064(-)